MKERNPLVPRVVALGYRRDTDRAPRVLASGAGEIAKKILALADEFGIPLQQNEELTYLLSQVIPGEEIPESLYQAVAIVLAFVYGLDQPVNKTNN